MIKSDFRHDIPADPGTVHFVGIGGAGMSGIARLFVDAGLTVTGSDSRESDAVLALRALGVSVQIGHSATHLGDASTVVVTGAISENNPEYREALGRGLPTVHRAKALAWLTRGRRLVAVAGAHGKTTSTAMVVTALRSLNVDAGFVNGGVIRSLNVSASSGDDDIFVVEADESDGSFLLYDTAIALITNVDPDHLDFFGSEEKFLDAFVDFARGASEAVVISSDDEGARTITPRLDPARVTTFGQHPDSDIRVHSVHLGENPTFTLAWNGSDFPVSLTVPGLHNVLNAAGAFGVLVRLGFDPRASLDAIAGFGGTERRFEFRGEVAGVRIFDDFAHHPTEVAAALAGARAVVGAGRVIPIFQPHLFSRTRMLAHEFASVLESLADFTVLVPIYAARQDPEPGVTSQLIADRFSDSRGVISIDDWDEAAGFAAALARPGDILMPMGGGDIAGIVPALLEALEAHRVRLEAESRRGDASEVGGVE